MYKDITDNTIKEAEAGCAGNKELSLNFGMTRLGLYIHIPFCVKKCGYCDFLSAPADEDTIRMYFNALLTEIRSYEGRTNLYYVPTIYIGGGTPSAVDAHYIGSILEAVREVFRTGAPVLKHQYDAENTEITIEANPGSIDNDKLTLYKEAGINRLSFGLQSVHDDELKLLGRIHTFRQFEENYHMARSMGYNNINIDLISALPGQTLSSWKETLRITARFKPQHISAYGLIIEEGTPFFKKYGEGAIEQSDLPDEDTDRAIYGMTKDILEEYGYLRYEISNYSLPGYICRHNTSYWTGIQYLGLGLGASSLVENTRFHNTAGLPEYLGLCKECCNNYNNASSGQIAGAEGIHSTGEILRAGEISNIEGIHNNGHIHNTGSILGRKQSLLSDSIGIRRDIQQLTIMQEIEEFMFLGLRMTGGISRRTFLRRFNTRVDDVYGEILKKLEINSLIISDGDSIRLTPYGIDISNYVLSEFLMN